MPISRQGLACWQHRGLWFVGWLPAQSQEIREVGDLDSAFQRTEEWLNQHPGGQAVGIINYHAGNNLLATCPHSGSNLPQAVIHYFPEEHLFSGGHDECLDQISAVTGSAALGSPFKAMMDRDRYLSSVERIKSYLVAGDAYQVNFARAFSAKFTGDPLAAWLRLARAHPAPHACYVPHDQGAVFGVSPERFLRVEGRKISSEPIKGSRPRGEDPTKDNQLAESLLGSDKDRAENLMIVDLMRNDLGKVCETGSVDTAALFELRRFSNVQHLVSVITGTLQPTVSPLQALMDCFPGGSITGAPKKRAMEIINELETTPRHYYCGSQFSLDGSLSLDSSILIRTFQAQAGELLCHGGGGIVADSNPQEEYSESGFKVQALMDCLELPEL